MRPALVVGIVDGRRHGLRRVGRRVVWQRVEHEQLDVRAVSRDEDMIESHVRNTQPILTKVVEGVRELSPPQPHDA